MSMTREEAIELLKRDFEFMLNVAIENAHGEKSEIKQAKQFYKEQMAALSILAPSPRKEPPVELDGNVWYSDVGDLWVLTAVDYVRKHWRDGEQWLPLSALPVPEGGA